MTKKNGQASVIQYSPARKRKMDRAMKGTAKRRAARSGEVVIRQIGDEKVSPPSPSTNQINRQERRL